MTAGRDTANAGALLDRAIVALRKVYHLDPAKHQRSYVDKEVVALVAEYDRLRAADSQPASSDAAGWKAMRDDMSISDGTHGQYFRCALCKSAVVVRDGETCAQCDNNILAPPPSDAVAPVAWRYQEPGETAWNTTTDEVDADFLAAMRGCHVEPLYTHAAVNPAASDAVRDPLSGFRFADAVIRVLVYEIGQFGTIWNSRDLARQSEIKAAIAQAIEHAALTTPPNAVKPGEGAGS